MSIINDTTLVALELSNSLWLVGTRTPGAQKSRMHRIEAGDTAALLASFQNCAFGRLRKRRPSRAALKLDGTGSGFTGYSRHM